MKPISKAQNDRQITRRTSGRYQEYDKCEWCGRTITDKTGWCHISDDPEVLASAKLSGKSTIGMICGQCADNHRKAAGAKSVSG